MTSEEINARLEELRKESAVLYNEQQALRAELVRRDTAAHGETILRALQEFGVEFEFNPCVAIRLPDADWIASDEMRDLKSTAQAALNNSGQGTAEMAGFVYRLQGGFPTIRVAPVDRGDAKAWEALISAARPKLGSAWGSGYALETLDVVLPLVRAAVKAEP